MSYSFDGVNDTMTGTFGTTYAKPFTLAVFMKLTAHPSQADEVMVLGNVAASNNDRYALQIQVTPNQYAARSVDAGGTGNNALIDYSINGPWVAYVGVFTADNLRDVYLQSTAHTVQDTTNRVVSDTCQFIRLGETLTGANDFTGKLAEVAIWNKALSLGELDNYMAGIRASTISPGNLPGYWPLDTSNSTQANQGIDTGGALTVVGATFDSDHPVITVRGPMHYPRRVYLPNN